MATFPPADRERELIVARERIAEVVGRPVDEAAVPLGLYDRGSWPTSSGRLHRGPHERADGGNGRSMAPAEIQRRRRRHVESIERSALTDPSHTRAW